MAAPAVAGYRRPMWKMAWRRCFSRPAPPRRSGRKDGASQEGAAAELQMCQAQAPVEPRVQGPRGMPSGTGGERKAAFNTMAEREGERMQKDQRFVGECMRGKGYSEK